MRLYAALDTGTRLQPRLAAARRESPVRYRITDPNGQAAEFDHYCRAPATYEAAMRSAGCLDFQWIDAAADPAEPAISFWDDFMAQAPLIAFRTTKRSRR